MDATDKAQLQRWRGVILELVYDGHSKQKSRLDHLALWGLMQDLGHNDVSQREVITMLQQLRDRGYLTFEDKRDRWSGHVSIAKIQITPAGCDLIEDVKEDPAVKVL